jgi:hypothetical protein
VIQNYTLSDLIFNLIIIVKQVSLNFLPQKLHGTNESFSMFDNASYSFVRGWLFTAFSPARSWALWSFHFGTLPFF